jgi:hypothetical protein
MVVISITVGVLLSIMGGISSDYGVNIDDGANNNLTALNKLDVIRNNTEVIEEQVFSQQESSGITDLLGKYLGAGYQSIKLITNSMGAFYDMINVAFSNTFLGVGLGFFKTGILIISMIIIVFIVISVLTGRDKL